MKYKIFKHDLKPYYDYTDEEAQRYKYFKDFLFLMSGKRSEQLFNLGLPIYAIYPDGTQIKLRK